MADTQPSYQRHHSLKKTKKEGHSNLLVCSKTLGNRRLRGGDYPTYYRNSEAIHSQSDGQQDNIKQVHIAFI
jgi:hypothetical protein